MCRQLGCKKTSVYNVAGEAKAMFCGIHKQAGMVNVKNKRCQHEGCTIQPHYAMAGDKAVFCAIHKQDGMVDVKNKTCQHKGCSKQPAFAMAGDKAVFCAIHKQDGMVDVKNKTCQHEECTIRPHYAMAGDKAVFCATHKQDGMVDVKNKRCQHEGCTTIPNFAMTGDKAVFCAIHKQDRMVDVKNKSCQHEGCTIRPHFAMAGDKAVFCATHKQDGMVDVVNKRCQHEGCTIQPHFAMAGDKAVFCAIHKQDRMVDVISKMCKSTWCTTRVQDKYDGYCLHCYMHLFPDQPVSRNYKTKEFAVVEYVQAHFPHFDWVADKTVNGGCSRRRPDLLLDLGYQVIIVEVDENQHVDYDCSCENKRMMLLSKDVGHRPLVFIRFNPDEYDDVSSCWGINGHGICAIKKTKRNEWADRLNALKDSIQYWSEPENQIDKMVEVVQLFYDTC